ncbi:bacillithiol biosynthesis BshC [bacterium]|nr:MAG: bacillithiol biosynthesis BshC [bacterium]
MAYRVERLPLTAVRGSGSRASTLARLSRRRTKLPSRVFTSFVALARKLSRPRVAPLNDDTWPEWVRQAGGGRRHVEAIRAVQRRDSLAIVVPLLKGAAAPRMDEVLRLLTGLQLAKLLRKRQVENVAVLAWPVLSATDEAEAGGSAIVQRSGDLEDINFTGGDPQAYLERLRTTLPGTGFSAWLIDQLARAASEDADRFKARLLLRLFEDDGLALLAPHAAQGGEQETFEKRLERLGGQIPLLGVIRDGMTGPSGKAPPLSYPSISATMVEGKVEQWLTKFGISAEEVLAREAKPEALALRHLPRDLSAVFSRFKEGVLGAMLRAELSLNELGFAPVADVKRGLDNFDMGCDRLRQRAVAEAQREEEINRRQLAKLFHYMLPMGQPQQHVVSLLHYLDFYGPEFLPGLRASLEADDLRHQVLYLAPSKGDTAEV